MPLHTVSTTRPKQATRTEALTMQVVLHDGITESDVDRSVLPPQGKDKADINVRMKGLVKSAGGQVISERGNRVQ